MNDLNFALLTVYTQFSFDVISFL